MTRPLPRPKPPVRLDVSLAIVNIVLLLIFFFLATGRLLNPVGPDLELSQTSELPLDQLPSPILVIHADGTWDLNGNEVAPDLLDVALQNLPQPVVLHLLINREAPANALIQVINRPELTETEIRLVTLHRRAGQ
ncbi:biopolymer transporter ExbD [uncultured Litoreibacter sp.]|uniref:ExbD/TolR family protein n=1 Tax=uncultured Litoreibacter sp. TaxID=1392394 RepID=UPI0026030623|nr:biopolymer transporter ExbD [uncultured Litoreibacter sp.]